MEYLDLMDPKTFSSGFPAAYFENLRKKDPLHWHYSQYDKRYYWIVTLCGHFDFIKKRNDIFSSEEKAVTLSDPQGEDWERSRMFLINMDSPRHHRYRKIVSKSFSFKMMEKLRVKLALVAKRLVDNVIDQNYCDGVTDFASKMPAYALAELLGIPEDQYQLIAENSHILTFFDEPENDFTASQVKTAGSRLFALAIKTYEKIQSGKDDSLAGDLVNKKSNEDVLDLEEFCFFFVGLMIAGFETTKSVISNSIRLMAENPDHYQKLRNDPEMLNVAVEEIIRMEPPVYHMCRTAKEDIEIDNKLVKKGDKLVLFYHSINRDAALNAVPDVFNVNRTDIKHRSFGIGPHFCLGVHLARVEAQVMLKEIISRFSAIKFDGECTRMWSRDFNTFVSIPLKLFPDEY